MYREHEGSFEGRGGTLDQKARERIFESSKRIALEVKEEVEREFSEIEQKIQEFDSQVPFYTTFNRQTLLGKMGYEIFRCVAPDFLVTYQKNKSAGRSFQQNGR